MLAVLPNVLAMSIILLVGLVAAWSIGHVVERLLRVIGLDHLTNRLGVNAALARGGVKADPSHLVGRAGYWLVVVFTAMAALGALNLQPINQFAQSFLAYIPHLFTAALILVAGYLLSNFVSQAVLIAAVCASAPARASDRLRQPTVNEHRGAGHIRSPLRAQENGDRRELLRRSEPSRRDPRPGALRRDRASGHVTIVRLSSARCTHAD